MAGLSDLVQILPWGHNLSPLLPTIDLRLALQSVSQTRLSLASRKSLALEPCYDVSLDVEPSTAPFFRGVMPSPVAALLIDGQRPVQSACDDSLLFPELALDVGELHVHAVAQRQ